MYQRQRKIRTIPSREKITVSIDSLVEMTELGINSAREIGEKAGAVVWVGRRKLYLVEKIIEYMRKLNEEQQNITEDEDKNDKERNITSC